MRNESIQPPAVWGLAPPWHVVGKRMYTEARKLGAAEPRTFTFNTPYTTQTLMWWSNKEHACHGAHMRQGVHQKLEVSGPGQVVPVAFPSRGWTPSCLHRCQPRSSHRIVCGRHDPCGPVSAMYDSDGCDREEGFRNMMISGSVGSGKIVRVGGMKLGRSRDPLSQIF